MALVDVNGLRAVVDAAVTGVSVLGGGWPTSAVKQLFGAPPVLLFVVAYGCAALASKTQNWMHRHPGVR